MLFADRRELELWQEESGATPEIIAKRHFEVSEAQLAALASLFYGGRAAPDFARRGLDEILATFGAAGLVGDFWALP